MVAVMEKTTATNIDGGGNASATIVTPQDLTEEMAKVSELWLKPFESGVLEVSVYHIGPVLNALSVENELRLLDKYAGVEEEALQRKMELARMVNKTEEQNAELEELYILGAALQRVEYRAYPPSSSRGNR